MISNTERNNNLNAFLYSPKHHSQVKTRGGEIIRGNYKTTAKILVREAMPRKGFINIKEIAIKTGLPRSTVWYQVRLMNDVRKVSIGVTKHKYFISQRIDKWIWQKICRYARQGREKLRHYMARLKNQELKVGVVRSSATYKAKKT